VLLLASACGTPDDNKQAATTATPGGPAAGADWEGKTYLLRTVDADWATPRGIGKDIGPYVPGFLLHVDSATGNEVGVTVGTVPAAGPDEQDPCTATQAITGMSAAAPSISIGPTDFTSYLVNGDYAVNAHIRGLQFSNVLPGGTDGTLTATLDFREVVNLLTLLATPDPNTACTALEQSGDATCEPCPQDGQPYCLTIVATPVEAVEYTGAFAPIASATCPDKLRETPAPAATQ
jgi:hypothetical protein